MNEIIINNSTRKIIYTSAAINGILSNTEIMKEVEAKFGIGEGAIAVAKMAINVADETIELEDKKWE